MDVEGELLSMAIVNGNYAKLQDSYLFTDIAKRVAAFTAAHPEKKIIKMGIGDVTLPLAPCVVDAMKKAVEELGHKETFRGYGPEQGYEFLHEAIQKYYARSWIRRIFLSVMGPKVTVAISRIFLKIQMLFSSLILFIRFMRIRT